MQDKRHTIRNLIWLFWLVTIVLSISAYSSNAAEPLPVESGVISQAFELISEGKFDAADELIKQSNNNLPQLNRATPRLLEVVDQYKSISQQRQSAKEAAYAKALEELEKLQAPTEANDVNDVNETDNLISALSAINKTGEFADEAQKKLLLSIVNPD